MTDFLFHTLSDKEKEDVKKEAKKLMDSFSEKLSKVKISDDEPTIKRKEFEREEGDGKDINETFKGLILENAPNKNENFIIAEKKKWD